MMFLCILTGDPLRLRRYSSHIAELAAIYMFCLLLSHIVPAYTSSPLRSLRLGLAVALRSLPDGPGELVGPAGICNAQVSQIKTPLEANVPSKVLRIVAVSGSSSISSMLSMSTDTSEKNGSSSGKRCDSSWSLPGLRTYRTGCTYGLTSLRTAVSQSLAKQRRGCSLELVAVGVDLELAAVVVTLERDEVSEGADSAALVFPAHEGAQFRVSRIISRVLLTRLPR